MRPTAQHFSRLIRAIERGDDAWNSQRWRFTFQMPERCRLQVRDLRIFSGIRDFQQVGSCARIYPEIRIALAR